MFVAVVSGGCPIQERGRVETAGPQWGFWLQGAEVWRDGSCRECWPDLDPGTSGVITSPSHLAEEAVARGD